MFRCVGGKRVAQAARRERSIEAERQPAGDTAADGSGIGDREIQHAQRLTGLVEKDQARLGRLHTLRRAVEQRHGENVFERAQPVAQCRLADADHGGGAAKTSMFGDGKRQANGRQIEAKAAAGFYDSRHLITRIDIASLLIHANSQHDNFAMLKG